MENLTFVHNSLIFIAINSIALLAINFKKVGRQISFYSTLAAAIIFFLMLFFRETFTLSELFILDGNKVFLAKIVSVLNVFMILINGQGTLKRVKNSVLMSYMFLGSIFLLGAKDLMTFYVAMETVALVGYALVATSELKNSNEAAIKYLIQGAIASMIFLLGAAFYLGATGELSLATVSVNNHDFYAIAISLFVITACFKLGAFPFQAWVADVYSSVSLGNLATNFFISKIVVGFKFITVLQTLLLEVNPKFQGNIILIVQWVAVFSAFYGNAMAIVQGQFKRIIAYSSVAHTGYLLMIICISPEKNLELELIGFLTMYSLTATGVILILNQFASAHGNIDSSQILKAGFYKNKALGLLLTVFVLSLGGIPLTSGFALKYMLFTSFFKEGFTFQAVIIFISSIIGLAYYIRFVSDLFSEDELSLDSASSVAIIKTRFSEGLVHVIILLSVFIVGIAPSLIFSLK